MSNDIEFKNGSTLTKWIVDAIGENGRAFSARNMVVEKAYSYVDRYILD